MASRFVVVCGLVSFCSPVNVFLRRTFGSSPDWLGDPALSVLAFKGQRAVNSLILFQMFHPAIILLVPTFPVIQNISLYDAYLGMILPWVLSVWAVFVYSIFVG